MAQFYLDQYTLNYLAQLILTLVITGYLVSLPNKTAAARWFLLLFGSMTVFAAVSIVKASSLWTPRFYTVHLGAVILVVALSAALQFASRYPRDTGTAPSSSSRHRVKPTVFEARLALGISILMMLYVSIGAIYQFTQLRPGGSPNTSVLTSELCLVVLCLWSIITFLRRSLYFSQQIAPEVPLWRHCWQPQGRAAQTAFAFVPPLLVAMTILILAMTQAHFLMLERRTSEMVPSVGSLIALFMLALAYVNHAPERTSFQAKLVGISLVAVLLVLTPIGTIMAGELAKPIRPALLDAVPRTVHFAPRPAGGFTVTTLPLAFDEQLGVVQEAGPVALPFRFSFAGIAYDQVWVKRGALAFSEWRAQALNYNVQPAIFLLFFQSSVSVGTTLYVNSADDALTATWLTDGEQRAAPLAIQAKLYADGSFDLTYRALDVEKAKQIGFQTGNGGQNILPFDLFADYKQLPVTADAMFIDFDQERRALLHQRLLPVAYLLILSGLAAILLFPRFYQTILIRPLNVLTEGVKAVNQGDLSVRLPVQYYDEIGLVTDAFNRMTASVQQAEHQLEGQVAERTAALATSETRFRTLFEQMTSGIVLLEPLDEGDNYRVRNLNQAGARIAGVEKAGLVGKQLSAWLSPPDFVTVHRVLKQATAGDAPPILLPTLYQDANDAWREILAYPLPTGEMVLVFADVTARIKAQGQKQQLAAVAEREQMGRELHDNLLHGLAAVEQQAQTVMALLAQDDDGQAQVALQQLIDDAQDAQGELRQTMLGLEPTISTTGATEDATPSSDFLQTLNHYLQSQRTRYNLHTQLSLPEEWPTSPFAPTVETQVLRILQEALTNARRHSATNAQGHKAVRLLFLAESAQIKIIVADDGPGFDPTVRAAEPVAPGGLALMRQRAAQIGGTFTLRSSPTGGTEIIIEVPRLLLQPTDDAAGARLLLVDDHQLYLDGLHQMLTARGLQIVGTARDGLEAYDEAVRLRPDLILMDIQMPRCNGLEATKRIKAQLPEMKILILTAADEGQLLFDALKEGATGYLLKSLPGDEFFQLLLKALAGEMALDPDLATQKLVEFAEREQVPEADENALAALTTRQIEVLTFLAAGKSNKEIATELQVTESTIKYHVSEMLNRLGLRSRHELAHFARARG